MKNSIMILLIALFTCPVNAQESGHSPVTTFILIRHAEKADDGTNNPALTAEGRERAQSLKRLLAHSEVSGIYSTPYQRTRQTVQPLAELLGLAVKDYNPGDPGFIKEILEANRGKTVVVSGHSNTTPMVANALLGYQKFGQLGHEEYDKVFIVNVLEIGKGNVVRFSY